jgi:hypothetical protein
MNDGKSIDDLNDSRWCVSGAATAGVTSNSATGACRFARKRGTTLYEELVRDRFELEKVQGADFDTISACGACIDINLRQAFPVHGNCFEGTGLLTITQTDTTPRACSTSPIDQNRCSTGRDPAISGQLSYETFTSSTF